MRLRLGRSRTPGLTPHPGLASLSAHSVSIALGHGEGKLFPPQQAGRGEEPLLDIHANKVYLSQLARLKIKVV